jgi:hypothetical protein
VESANQADNAADFDHGRSDHDQPLLAVLVNQGHNISGV